MAASCWSAPAAAQGDLLIAPTRVIVSGAGSSEVVLSNIGNTPATYRISLELRRMEPDGNFREIAEAEATPAEKAALEMVRHAPRRITLLPGQPQAVRISARPAPELPDGEYRVHMSFRAVPPAVTPEDAARDAAAAGGGLTIKLTPVYGITIPVFVRKGNLDGKAAIANAHLVRNSDGAYVELDMTRSGQRSVYGELIGKTPSGAVLFTMRGVAVYAELTKRTVRVPIGADRLGKLRGPVRIEYRELPENGGQLLAETTANLN
ncbi:MAG TPA: molecular chaperone [Novosphingobium sp.]|nr:molecular chaperone [Novosphingobium sp.]HPZ45775.1 molecular chaperone [Novosphingobium sp.]